MKTVWNNKLALVIFGADMLSNFGDTLYYMALMNYILFLPDPKLALSAVTLSETLPMILGLPIGIRADKTARKLPHIIATLLVRFVLYLLIGFIMGFSPALWIVFLASGINFVSDLAGIYENSLFTPVFLRLVAEEDREVFMGFRQSAGAIFKIIFQASGAVLIGILSYQHLAFFNALTFGVSALLIFLIRPKINRLLQADPIKVVEPSGQQHIVKEMLATIRELYAEVRKHRVLVASMVIVPFLNAVMSICDTLIVLIASHNPQFLIRDLPTTLALFVAVAMAGNIIGGALTMSIAKDWSILSVVKATTIFPVLMYLAFYLENVYLFFAVLLLACITAGIVNPKFGAIFMSAMPEERLGSFGEGLNAYFTMGIVLVKLVVSGLVLVLTSQQIAGIFLFLSLALVIWSFAKYKTVKE